jgi:hypothetical protein
VEPHAPAKVEEAIRGRDISSGGLRFTAAAMVRSAMVPLCQEQVGRLLTQIGSIGMSLVWWSIRGRLDLFGLILTGVREVHFSGRLFRAEYPDHASDRADDEGDGAEQD